MKSSLKYTVPLVILCVGLIGIITSSYFYNQILHESKMSEQVNRVNRIGNHLSKSIDYTKLRKKSFVKELNLFFSGYGSANLRKAIVYDKYGKTIFELDEFEGVEKYNEETNYNVSKQVSHTHATKKAEVHSHYDNKRIDASFILSEIDGILYLEFDFSIEHNQILAESYMYTIINTLIIAIMSFILSFVLYIMVFKRVQELYNMTLELSKGNYDVRIPSTYNDELTGVTTAFNEMAKIISKNEQTLEHKIENEVEKNRVQMHILMKQNRLVAMGEMINNIAHQWRQPLNTLAIIIQKFELLSSRGILNTESINKNVTQGMVQVKKMSTTIDDFRNFFKLEKEMKTFYLKEMIEETFLFLQNSIDEHQVQVNYNIEASTQMKAYKNELSQVLINLISNAKDALISNREKDRIINIKCNVKHEHMILSIEDNAGGIDENILDKIFEPYFTTKEESKGTGLGLYMSKMIIEDNMNGKLCVENTNTGAAFRVILSIAEVNPFCEISCNMKDKYEN